MMKKILISVANIQLEAELNDNKTADRIWNVLPIRKKINTWGNEFYFSIGIDIPLEKNASDVVQVGEIAYWPPGQAFCIFFGTTPASIGNEARAASHVNVFGRIIGEIPEELKSIRSGAEISIKEQNNI